MEPPVHHDKVIKLDKRRPSRHQLDHGKFHSLAHKILTHWMFEPLFALFIGVNLIFVVIDTDNSVTNAPVQPWMEVVGWTILTAFVFELALRLYVERSDFKDDAANVFDFVLVVTDTILQSISLFAGHIVPISFLRVARLAKLARIAKAFRLFPELRLLMSGLIGSLKTIFWGTAMLAVALLTYSIIAVQFIHPLNESLAEAGKYEDCERCPRAYSSVFNAFVTFTQQIIAGDSWGWVTVPVIEAYPATGIFYALVFVSLGLAVMNLILGVVVDVACQAKEASSRDLETEKLIHRQEMQCNLLEICREMDHDGNGVIDKDEMFAGFWANDRFRHALLAIEVQEDDLELLWTILDADQDGTVSYEEFVNSCYKLRSSDQAFMLSYIKYYVTVIKNQICHKLADVGKGISQEERQLEDGVAKLAHEIEHVESMIARQISPPQPNLVETSAGVVDCADKVPWNHGQKEDDQNEKSLTDHAFSNTAPTGLPGRIEINASAFALKSNEMVSDLLKASDQRHMELKVALEEIKNVLVTQQLAANKIGANGNVESTLRQSREARSIETFARQISGPIETLARQISGPLPTRGESLGDPDRFSMLLAVPGERAPLGCCRPAGHVKAVVVPMQGPFSPQVKRDESMQPGN